MHLPEADPNEISDLYLRGWHAAIDAVRALNPQLDAAYSALTQIRAHADSTGDAALQQLLTSLGVHP
jgi:hypothetical protein